MTNVAPAWGLAGGADAVVGGMKRAQGTKTGVGEGDAGGRMAGEMGKGLQDQKTGLVVNFP